MSSPRYEVLVHRLIDDEITDAERAELDTLIADSSEARAFYESMIALSHEGRQAEVVPAPADLREQVLGQIDHARYRSTRPQAKIGFRDFIKSILTARLAYGLAAGLILGIALGSIAMKQSTGPLASITPGDVTGTVGMPASSGKVERVTTRSFGVNGATGRLTADQFGNHGTVRIAIDSDVPSEITLEFDPAAATVQTFEQQADGLLGATIDNGRVTLSHQGDNSYTAMFRLGEAPLTVTCQIRVGGQSFRERVTFSAVGE